MSIGVRINARMKSLGLKPKDITNATGASKATVSQWINDISAPSATYLTPLSEALDCSEKWLIYGEGGHIRGDNVSGARYSRGLVPVISKVQAGSFREEFDEFEPGKADEYLPCPRPHSKYTYALRVDGDSMTAPSGPSVVAGSIIYCDPDQAAGVVSGDLVVAKIKGEDEVTFKQYIRDGSRQFLKPLNTSYPVIADEFRILAKVIGLWRDI